MLETKKFYGVYIPKDLTNEDVCNDSVQVFATYEEASALLKKCKNARFKIFSSEEEAKCFAECGSSGGTGNPAVVLESVSFKSLKRPEIHKFRRCIETHDYASVENLIWENPHYLISIGDTPTIMQEGPRYNALHIAAKFNAPSIAELILNMVSSHSFIKSLYGAAGENSYVVRPEVLVDLYLNTPDKGLNETPLHFACKYGAIDVVSVFVRYPELQTNVKNKYDQTPKDITCKSCESSPELISRIHKLLSDLYFVPVWRSNDDIVQPVIGKPYSPKTPPTCPGVTSPVSPSMEIKAIAGPMSLVEANNFHKTWKLPIRTALHTSPSKTPHPSKGILLRSPLESDKGLEKIGRTLAFKFHVSWKEYWPFLNRFVDLRTEEGMKMLDNYLHEKITVEKTRNKSKCNDDVALTPISELCDAFAKCSIISPCSPPIKPSSIVPEKDRGDSVTTPFLLLENICKTFADNICEKFSINLRNNMPIEDNVVVLIKKVRNLHASIDTCKNDMIFKNIPFDKIHCRIAFWITRIMCNYDSSHLNYATSTFRLVQTTNKCEMMRRITLSPKSGHMELERIVRTMKCINNWVVKYFSEEVSLHEKPTEELICQNEWIEMNPCSCVIGDNVVSPFRKRVITRKKILFPDDDNDSEAIFEAVEKSKVTNSIANCDIEFDMSTKINCDNENSSNSDDEFFFTPPSSLSTSEDEMDLADEGPEIFIYGDKGSSMDNAALEAIADVEIDKNKYPNIYRWKHCITLHNSMDRFSWATPKPVDKSKKY